MKSIEVSARSKETAILEGLTILQTTYEKVRIDVLVEGGLFSKCKLRMTLLEEKEETGTLFERLERTRLVESELNKTAEKKGFVEKTEASKKPVPQDNQQRNPKNKGNQQKDKQFKPNDKQRTEKPKLSEKPKPSEKPKLAEKQRNDKQFKPNERAVEPQVKREKPQGGNDFDGDGFGRIKDFDKLRAFLQELLDKMKFEAKVDLVQAGDDVVFNINTQDMGAVIGFRGETLDAIQLLLMQIIHKDLADGKKIVVDCQNYREKRAGTLTVLAERMAKKAVQTGRKVRLEPMSSIERRVIHSALSGNLEVTTYSEGNEPSRHLVIVPKNQNKNNNHNKKPRPRSNLGGSNFSENAGQPKVSGFEEYHFNKKER